MEKAKIIDISLELFAVSLGINVKKVTMIKVISTTHISIPIKYMLFILTNGKKSQNPTFPIFGDLAILFIRSCGLPTLVVTKTNIVAKINRLITTGTKTPLQ